MGKGGEVVAAGHMRRVEGRGRREQQPASDTPDGDQGGRGGRLPQGGGVAWVMKIGEEYLHRFDRGGVNDRGTRTPEGK